MIPSIGIDDLNLYASTLCIDYAEIALKRGDLARVLKQTQFHRRSVLPSFEDPVTLAVNAAKPLVDSAGPEKFELLIVATETGLDFGKPLSTYIHKYLGLPASCRNFEIKHACYAGTAAIQMAANWLKGHVNSGGDPKALVVMTDVPRCSFGASWELSLGLGAVAVSLSRSPRIAEIESCSGCAAQEVYDVARPTATLEYMNPVLSVASYLELFEMATTKYRQAVGGVDLQEHCAYMLYHTPFVQIVRKAHQILVEQDGKQPSQEEMESSFVRMVSPSLRYLQEVGNIYSGSLYAGLAGLIDTLESLQQRIRIGFFSYGSGACAEFFSMVLRPESQEVLSKKHIGDALAKRNPITFSEYEAAEREVEQNLNAQHHDPDMTWVADHYQKAYAGRQLLVLQRVKNYYRSYGWS